MDPISNKPVTPLPTPAASAMEMGATRSAGGPREAFAVPSTGPANAASAPPPAGPAWTTARQQIQEAMRSGTDKTGVMDRFVAARASAQLGPLATPQVVRQVADTLKGDVQFKQIFEQLYQAAMAPTDT